MAALGVRSNLLTLPSKVSPQFSEAGKRVPLLLPKRIPCFSLRCSNPNKSTGPLSSQDEAKGAAGDDSGNAEVLDKEGKEERLRRVEGSLAKLFGGPLWFIILILFLTVFGGAYGYLIFNFADVADVPILGVTR